MTETRAPKLGEIVMCECWNQESDQYEHAPAMVTQLGGTDDECYLTVFRPGLIQALIFAITRRGVRPDGLRKADAERPHRGWRWFHAE